MTTFADDDQQVMDGFPPSVDSATKKNHRPLQQGHSEILQRLTRAMVPRAGEISFHVTSLR